ncbi:hypothetical protein COL154_014265, partial [Colletotrichum chrysophilum]
RLEGKLLEHRLQEPGDLRILLQHRLADDRRRLVDWLNVLVVGQHDGTRTGDAAIRAVDHGEIGAVRLVRRRLDRCRRVAARKRDELIGLQLEIIGLFERRQRRFRVHEFRRGRKLGRTPLRNILAEVRQRDDVVLLRHILAHGDAPGVVGGRRRQPDDLVGLVVELLGSLIRLLGILPDRFLRLVEEEGGVTRVFGIDVDLSGDDRFAHDRRTAEVQTRGRRDLVRIEYRQNHVADDAAFRIDLG